MIPTSCLVRNLGVFFDFFAKMAELAKNREK